MTKRGLMHFPCSHAFVLKNLIVIILLVQENDVPDLRQEIPFNWNSSSRQHLDPYHTPCPWHGSETLFQVFRVCKSNSMGSMTANTSGLASTMVILALAADLGLCLTSFMLLYIHSLEEFAKDSLVIT